MAAIQLAEDFLSTIVFLIAYFVTGNLYVAVAASVATGAGQWAVLKLRRRRIDVMVWLSLLLVVVFGVATLVTNDASFMMAKPSLIHFAIGIVMLRPGWLRRYLPPIVTDNVAASVLIGMGYVWAALMFVLGVANLFVATHYGIAVWAWFISAGAVGAKVALFLVQSAVLVVLIRRKFHPAAG